MLQAVDVTGLNDDEVYVVEQIVDRLRRLGHTNYGPLVLDADPRDFGRELDEELADAVFYAAVKSAGRRRGQHV